MNDKKYAIVDENGKLTSNKLYSTVGVARGVLTRQRQWSSKYDGWTVKQVRTMTTIPAATRTVYMTKGEAWGAVYRKPTDILDVVTDGHLVRVHRNGHVEYLAETVVMYN